MAATDFFLKIDTIKGESKDDKHKDEISVESWSFGLTNTGSFGHGGGGGAGKAAFQDLSFTSMLCAASPKLFAACATGEHIKSAILTCRKAGGKEAEYLIVTLSDVLVSSYNSSCSGGGDIYPMDQFSLNFAKIEVTYKGQDEKGGLGAAIKAGYDLAKNVKV